MMMCARAGCAAAGQASSIEAGAPAPDQKQLEQLQRLAASSDWTMRVFALLRLERLKDAGNRLEVEALVRSALTDPAWQVRCFAVRQAHVLNMQVPAEALGGEIDARVMRAALRHGCAIPQSALATVAAQLLRAKAVDELLLGIELAALSDQPRLRADGEKRAERLISNMDDAAAILVARRLGAALNLIDPPNSASQWRAWLRSRRHGLQFPPPGPRAAAGRRREALVSTIEDDTFTRLLNYLGSLRQRDLDLAIVMDFTSSMIPMINQARAGVDSLILFLRDISRQMRLAFIAYRDHDNKPVWEGQPFTGDVNAVRDYLFAIRITGGRDLPEAVYDGLAACAELKWNKQAARQIVLVGDAPPHEQDMYRLHRLLDFFLDSQITVHAVHVPMARPEGFYERLNPDRAQHERDRLAVYNQETGEKFQRVAEGGGGRCATLTKAGDLVPSIMHFAIEEAWWPVFDEFYTLYLELCR